MYIKYILLFRLIDSVFMCPFMWCIFINGYIKRRKCLFNDSNNTFYLWLNGPDRAVAMTSANGLVGRPTWFTTRYRRVGRMTGWLACWMAGWMDGWMDGWVDGWMDGMKCYILIHLCFKERKERKKEEKKETYIKDYFMNIVTNKCRMG